VAPLLQRIAEKHSHHCKQTEEIQSTQKSIRGENRLVRFPEFSADWARVVLPNVAGEETSVAVGAKFGWFIRLVKVASNRILTCSRNWSDFGLDRFPCLGSPARAGTAVNQNV
jgi:hypothetical protein